MELDLVLSHITVLEREQADAGADGHQVGIAHPTQHCHTKQ